MKIVHHMIAPMFCLCAAACYAPMSRPYENVQTIGVNVVVNRTLYRDVDFELTDAINREISAITGYRRTSPGSADAVIRCEISDYRELPEIIDENEQVTTQRLVAAATFSLSERRTGEVLSGPHTARWAEIHSIRTGRTQEEVREELLRKLAQQVVERLFAPWPENGA